MCRATIRTAARLDELALLEGQHRSPDHAGKDRRVHDGDREHHVGGMGPERRDDAEREEDGREREEHVHHAHEGLVGAAAGVAREKPERRARRQRRQHGGERHLERQACAVDEPGEEIAAEDIGAERERPARPGHAVLRNHAERAREREAVRRGAHHEERADDQEARERRAVPQDGGREAGEGPAGEHHPGRRPRGAGPCLSPDGSGGRASHRGRRPACWSPRTGPPPPAPCPGPARSPAG